MLVVLGVLLGCLLIEKESEIQMVYLFNAEVFKILLCFYITELTAACHIQGQSFHTHWLVSLTFI